MANLMNVPLELKMDDTNDVGKSWKSFKQSWAIYEIASGNIDKPENVRVATFLHVAGAEAVERYNSFSWENEEDRNILSKVIDKFESDCKGTTNILIERKKFFDCKQRSGESCEKYVAKLRIISSTCRFTDPEEHLRDQFVLNICNKRAQERLLEMVQGENSTLSFDKAIATVKNYEKMYSEIRNTNVNNDAEEVHQVRHRNNKHVTNSNKCQRCGNTHAIRQCPAYGKTCSKCKKSNHFAKMCLSRKFDRKHVNALDEESGDENPDIESHSTANETNNAEFI